MLPAVIRWTTTLATTWGVAVSDVPRVVINDRKAIAWVVSDHGDLVVTSSCDVPLFGRFDAVAQLLRVLADRGVPVAEPVTAPDGRARVVVDGPLGRLPVGVLPHVDGDRGLAPEGSHRLAALIADLPDLPDLDDDAPGRPARWSRATSR